MDAESLIFRILPGIECSKENELENMLFSGARLAHAHGRHYNNYSSLEIK
jgi:hypothetical protein